MSKNIAILTGGGDCPGLNAVIRAVVRTAINEHGWQVIGFKDGYRGLVEDDWRSFSSADVANILDKGGTVLGTSNKHNPANYFWQGRYQDMREQAKANLQKHNIDALILIGGDGTMASGEDFRQMGVNIVGVPKTIDNDLMHTDFTFGFHTAVDTATYALDSLHATAESHHRIMVLEVMGRYAGWIALYAGMAGGADIILIPEIGYNIEQIKKAILKRREQGKSFSLVVAAEGAKEIGGEMIIKEMMDDSPDPIRLGGIGHYLAEKLEDATQIESRSMVLGHLQRGGRPNPYDRLLSSRYGAKAVQAVAEGNFGVMMALQGNDIVSIPLSQIAGKQKLVPLNHQLIKIGKNMGVCFGD